MKTIEQVVFDKYKSDQSLPKHKRMEPKNYIDWANYGAREAQRWIPVEEELPEGIEIGETGTKLSCFVIAKCKNGSWHKARVYSYSRIGFIDFDWLDEKDCVIGNVIEWRPIERK